MMGKEKEPNCELCGNESALHYEADSANLCYKCDPNAMELIYWWQGMSGWFYVADAINTLK
jgi:hypothetical protein